MCVSVCLCLSVSVSVCLSLSVSVSLSLSSILFLTTCYLAALCILLQRWLERTPGLDDEEFAFWQKLKENVESDFDRRIEEARALPEEARDATVRGIEVCGRTCTAAQGDALCVCVCV